MTFNTFMQAHSMLKYNMRLEYTTVLHEQQLTIGSTTLTSSRMLGQTFTVNSMVNNCVTTITCIRINGLHNTNVLMTQKQGLVLNYKNI